MRNIEEPRFIRRQRNRAEDERRSDQHKKDVEQAKVLLDCQTQNKAANKKQKNRRRNIKEWREWFTLILLIFTAGFTGTYTYFSRQQLSVAIDTEKRQLRGYVYLTPNIEDFELGKVPSIYVEMKDGGATPIHRVVTYISLDFEGDAAREVGANPPHYHLGPRKEVGEGDYAYQGKTLLYGNEYLFVVNQSFIDTLVLGNKGLIFFYGRIEYDDVFNETHSVDFCYFTFGNRIAKNYWGACADYNTAN